MTKLNTKVLSFSQTESERVSHLCTSTKLHSSSPVKHSQSLTKHLSIAVCDCDQNPKLPKASQDKPPTREADSRAAILPPQFFKCGGKTATGLRPKSKKALGPKFYKRSRPQAQIKTATSQRHEALWGLSLRFSPWNLQGLNSLKGVIVMLKLKHTKSIVFQAGKMHDTYIF